MSRDYGDYLEDILYSIDAIEEFTYGLDLEDFLEDEKSFAFRVGGISDSC